MDDNISALGEKPPTFWDCSGSAPSIEPERVYLRFSLRDIDEVPNSLILRRTFLDAVHIAVLNDDSSSQVRSFTPAQLVKVDTNDMINAQLPPLSDAARYVVVAIDKPTHRIVFEQASLDRRTTEATPDMIRDLVLKSLLTGLLLMPLIMNLIFYGVLREQFVLWHAILTSSLALHIFIVSGIVHHFVKLGFNTIASLHILTFAMCICASLLFARSILEKDDADIRLRSALLYGAVWVALITLLHTAFPFAWRSVKTDLYYAAFVPILGIVFWMTWDALKNGSRAAKFIAIGWSPVIAVAVLRLFGQLTPWAAPTDAMMLLQIGAVTQVTATALAVADRFLAIRNQRDDERRRTGLLEEMADKDPLTGLFNRRAIEPRFRELFENGYHCFAVIDLDRFKAVNDEYGHMVGDEVLKTVASVLSSDENAIAMRMGGEEFMLLMVGEDAEKRAEAMRQAIPVRVARAVDGLDRLVTASMGMISVSLEAMPMAKFSDVYSRADRLLYDAKEQGRNCTVSERLSVFGQSTRWPPVQAA